MLETSDLIFVSGLFGQVKFNYVMQCFKKNLAVFLMYNIPNLMAVYQLFFTVLQINRILNVVTILILNSPFTVLNEAKCHTFQHRRNESWI